MGIAADPLQDGGEIDLGRGKGPANVETRVIVLAGREACGEIDEERGVERGGAFHADGRAQTRLGHPRHRLLGRDQQEPASSLEWLPARYISQRRAPG